jgi:hypothetical protein
MTMPSGDPPPYAIHIVYFLDRLISFHASQLEAKKKAAGDSTTGMTPPPNDDYVEQAVAGDLEELSGWRGVWPVDLLARYHVLLPTPMTKDVTFGYDADALLQLYLREVVMMHGDLLYLADIMLLGLSVKAEDVRAILDGCRGRCRVLANARQHPMAYSLSRRCFRGFFDPSWRHIVSNAHGSGNLTQDLLSHMALALDQYPWEKIVVGTPILASLDDKLNVDMEAGVVVVKVPQLSCHLQPRQDIVHVNNFAHVPLRYAEPLAFADSHRTKLAVLTLTRNPQVVQDMHGTMFFRHFLTSLKAALRPGDYQRYQIVVYVGYDYGDGLFDGAGQSEGDILDEITTHYFAVDQVQFKLVALPRYRRLTLLWNIVGLQAVRDGCRYLLQWNDDSLLLYRGRPVAEAVGDGGEHPGSSILDEFVRRLQANDDYGFVGPADQIWRCRLLTQGMVSYRHVDLFGFLFPPRIKDWFSDNWLTDVYAAFNLTQCLGDYTMQNNAVPTVNAQLTTKNLTVVSAVEPRYEACKDRSLWPEELAWTRQLLYRHLLSINAPSLPSSGEDSSEVRGEEVGRMVGSSINS